jgi:Cu-processing system permease protein
MLSFGLFNFTGDSTKGILGVSNLILLIIPMVSIIFTGISIYNATDFMRLLLTQPVGRTSIFLSHFIGICMALLYAFVIGVGIPVLFYCNRDIAMVIMLSGIILTIIFTSLSFYISLLIDEKVKGIGTLLLTWLYFAVIYDGLVLLIIKSMSDYPVEQYSMILALLNPIDMCRILIMFSIDISALMGLTGAVLQEYLGTATGKLAIYASLLLWVLIPLLQATFLFRKKDF